jgi:CheY-like chemotaxis protein
MNWLKRLFVCGSDKMKVNETKANTAVNIERKVVLLEVKEEKKEVVVNNNLKWNHLIVDDSEINRLVMRKYLQKLGETYGEANNGHLAIEKVKNEKYDVVWMDVKMPGISGIETTSLLRKGGYKGYIIGLTGQVEVEVVKDCKNNGMDSVLAKPILLKEIDHTISLYKTL